MDGLPQRWRRALRHRRVLFRREFWIIKNTEPSSRGGFNYGTCVDQTIDPPHR